MRAVAQPHCCSHRLSAPCCSDSWGFRCRCARCAAAERIERGGSCDTELELAECALTAVRCKSCGRGEFVLPSAQSFCDP
eukprot:SAG31_NODE_32143_length_359_cov_1.000000_1_plen_79_part_01